MACLQIFHDTSSCEVTVAVDGAATNCSDDAIHSPATDSIPSEVADEAPVGGTDSISSKDESRFKRMRLEALTLEAGELFKQSLALFDLHLGESSLDSIGCLQKIILLASSHDVTEVFGCTWGSFYTRYIKHWKRKCEELSRKKSSSTEEYRSAREGLAEAFEYCGQYVSNGCFFCSYLAIQRGGESLCNFEETLYFFDEGEGFNDDVTKEIQGCGPKKGGAKKGKRKGKLHRDKQSDRKKGVGATRTIADVIAIYRTECKRQIEEAISVLLDIGYSEDNESIQVCRSVLTNCAIDYCERGQR
jgi:hypothetical protein